MKKLIKSILDFFYTKLEIAILEKIDYTEIATKGSRTNTKNKLMHLIQLEQREEILEREISIFKSYAERDTNYSTLNVRDCMMSDSGVFVSGDLKNEIAAITLKAAEQELAEIRKEIEEIKLND